ncbi:MAG: NAD(P)/FAD-dependent oxidoreductase [Flavobacteriaceae bacterium]
MSKSFEILIVGAGTGGLMTAARMRKLDKSLSIGIIDPADTHYYQPAWTLVGAGTFDYQKTARPMADLIPEGVTWIKDAVDTFDPENNSVSTKESGTIAYDYLVVSPGLVMEPSMIKGLEEAMKSGAVCSNYTDPEHTWKSLQAFKGGNAIFTQPATPIKCGGAPQKIAYLAADYIRKNGLASKTNLMFATPGTTIFGVPVIRETLMKVIRGYGIHFHPYHNPVEIDGKNKIVYFTDKTPEDHACFSQKEGCSWDPQNAFGAKKTEDGRIAVPFDFLHLAPPQAAPKFIRESALANEAGWLDVHKHTLQHTKYPNIFGVGDVTSVPTAKTGAAIRKQVPVVIDNIFKLRKQNSLGDKSYNGYSSCPLVTGYGKMVLAEFDYDNNFTPDPKLKQMLVFDSSKEHWRLWMLKKFGLPYLYWNKMLKGEDV